MLSALVINDQEVRLTLVVECSRKTISDGFAQYLHTFVYMYTRDPLRSWGKNTGTMF